MVVTDSVKWSGDEEIAPILVRTQVDQAFWDAVERVDLRLGHETFVERVSAAAEDTANPWLVRVNALRVLAQRGATGELPVYTEAINDKDERIRLAAVTAMREFLTLREHVAVEILEAALHDSSPRVVSAALQMYGDRDPVPLRELVARNKDRDIQKIATDLIRAAEERGAPLARKDTLGTLERISAAGPSLTYRPTRRWPQWNASVGDVYVTAPKSKKAVLIASSVEVVNDVVPAFFTNDGVKLIYEQNRQVHARILATGKDTVIANGIAPRVLPFSNDVIYMTEVPAKRTETPNSVGLKYEVWKIPAAGGQATSIGQLNSIALNELNGNYATVRWSRIREQEGTFTLSGQMIDPFTLPSPFGK
jgi:hypothetical protein